MKYLKSLYAYTLIWQLNRLTYFRTLNFAGAKEMLSLRFFYSYFGGTILVRKKRGQKCMRRGKKTKKENCFMRRNYIFWVADILQDFFQAMTQQNNVNIKTTYYFFRVVQVGRARNIRGKKGKEIMQINKSISGTESCKTVQRWRSKVSQLQDIETKWDEDAINCRMDILVTAWNFTTLQ